MKPSNFYAETELDRASERRGDEGWIKRLLDDPNTRFVPVWRARNLVMPGETPEAAFLSPGEAAEFMDQGAVTVLLGLLDDLAHFAIDVSAIEDPAGMDIFSKRGEFTELRQVGSLLERNQGSLLSYARAITHWHRQHRHCGVCGAVSEICESGHLRVCSDPSCATQHFPRTDPAVIMLVTRDDRALLGRKAEWVPKMYSALAGFVEPGESLEQAVAREVMEEVGIEISDVRYHSSQPWPFPASLMLGFHAIAVTEEIDFNRDELEDARWFSRAELAAGGAGLARRSRSDSIARRLINGWIEEG